MEQSSEWGPRWTNEDCDWRCLDRKRGKTQVLRVSLYNVRVLGSKRRSGVLQRTRRNGVLESTRRSGLLGVLTRSVVLKMNLTLEVAVGVASWTRWQNLTRDIARRHNCPQWWTWEVSWYEADREKCSPSNWTGARLIKCRLRMLTESELVRGERWVVRKRQCKQLDEGANRRIKHNLDVLSANSRTLFEWLGHLRCLIQSMVCLLFPSQLDH